MLDSHHVERALLELLIDRARQDSELKTILCAVYQAGYMEGHVDGHNSARFADMISSDSSAHGAETQERK